MNLTTKALKTIERYRMVPPGASVIAAVSGGPDSVALLDFLLSLKESLNLDLSVAHLDHGLRGEESAEDARFVAGLARSMGLACHQEFVDLEKASKCRGDSLEHAGREIRYAFLRRVAEQRGVGFVATGHTLDDQAETVLIRLLRGAGPEGLSGIHPVVQKPGWPAVIRPLLEVRRQDVLDYIEARGLTFRRDSSNLDPAFLRNKVRQELLPLLEAYNPRVREALARTAEILREEDRFLARIADEVTKDAALQRGTTHFVDPEAVRDLDPALQRRVVRELMRRGGYPPAFERVETMLSQILTLGEDAVPLKPDRPDQAPAPLDYEIDCRIPGTVPIPGTIWTLKLDFLEGGQPDPLLGCGYTVHLSPALDSARLAIRNRRAGDRFHPLGGPGSRSLKRYFIDHRIPRDLRYKLPVLVAGSAIAWVAGGHIDQGFRVEKGDERVVQAVLERQIAR
ncbi:tRNA lysidine(34) synthetase TilS [Acidobacteriota bacterium]